MPGSRWTPRPQRTPTMMKCCTPTTSNSQLPSVKQPTSASLSRTPGAAKTDVRTRGVTTVIEGEKSMHTKKPLQPDDIE